MNFMFYTKHLLGNTNNWLHKYFGPIMLQHSELGLQQKYSRLRQPLQKFSYLYKAETVYEGRLKVILLLQVSSHDFEPTFIIFCLN